MTLSIRDSIIRIVAEAFPTIVYGYPRTYVVTSVGGDKRLDLKPPADAQYLPELNNVEQWGVGLVAPSEGSEVIVVFRDANPSRPIVVGFAWDRDSTLSVARVGDTVSVMLTPASFVGTVAGSPASGMIIWSPPQTVGTISTGSTKVEVE